MGRPHPGLPLRGASPRACRYEVLEELLNYVGQHELMQSAHAVLIGYLHILASLAQAWPPGFRLGPGCCQRASGPARLDSTGGPLACRVTMMQLLGRGAEACAPGPPPQMKLRLVRAHAATLLETNQRQQLCARAGSPGGSGRDAPAAAAAERRVRHAVLGTHVRRHEAVLPAVLPAQGGPGAPCPPRTRLAGDVCSSAWQQYGGMARFLCATTDHCRVRSPELV